MYMILFVLDDPDQLHQVLDAWETAGLSGVTIIESTGIQRLKRRPLPMRFIPATLDAEEGHLTLVALVDGEDKVHAALAAAEGVVGDLDGPHTGVFAAWPVSMTKGLNRRES